MTAGDSWDDLHGTKDGPERETFRGNLAAGLSSRRQAEVEARAVAAEGVGVVAEEEGEEGEAPAPAVAQRL